jgi:hypothetical protein
MDNTSEEISDKDKLIVGRSAVVSMIKDYSFRLLACLEEVGSLEKNVINHLCDIKDGMLDDFLQSLADHGFIKVDDDLVVHLAANGIQLVSLVRKVGEAAIRSNHPAAKAVLDHVKDKSEPDVKVIGLGDVSPSIIAALNDGIKEMFDDIRREREEELSDDD